MSVVRRNNRKWYAQAFALTVSCVLLSEAYASSWRRLASNADILGKVYKPTEPVKTAAEAGTFVKTKEIQDHAHFYSVAEVLTQWAMTTFALSAQAHKQLAAQPDGITGSTCVYDGTNCLFNPLNIASASFPSPSLPAELIVKQFAIEAFACRGASDRAACHLDSNCDWDGVTGACFLPHDPHTDFTASIAPCKDMIYSAHAATCWRRYPEPSAWRPCGPDGCRLYKMSGGLDGTEGIPEDRCMPDVQAVAGQLAPKEVYALMKHHFGSAMTTPGSNSTLDGDGAKPSIDGFGSCPTAALHHAMRTLCREVEEATCLADSRCGWMKGIVSGQHCVLSKDTAIELLLGTSKFTRAVIKAEAECGSATSAESCLATRLVMQVSVNQR